MIRFLILAGYFELSLYLTWSGKLDHYINLHYSYLAYLSMALTFLLALIQLRLLLKEEKTKGTASQRLAYLVLAIPLLVGFLFPTVSLDSTTVSAKGYQFPLAAGASAEIQADEGTSSQYLKPDTSSYFTKKAYETEMQAVAAKYLKEDTIQVTTQNYMEFMEALYDYPDQFLGKEVQMTGFVYNDPKQAQQQFLFRFGIIHCIADSGVYGLLTTGQDQSYPDNTWISAKGKIAIHFHKDLKQSLPTLELTDWNPIEEPTSPYVYREF